MTVLGPGTQIDNYQLIRLIGSGSFGNVWLCRAEVISRFYALKILHKTSAAKTRRELDAIRLFKDLHFIGGNPGIIPVEHVGVFKNSIFYIMPLADGIDAESPEDPDWQPLTLARLIENWKLAENWASSERIKEIILPVLLAVEALSEAGLVHRDIKPENILMLGGRAVLSDISLLDADGDELSAAGTVGYSAPHWFLESGGHPDMFGIAATLYTALSGNGPEKIGRSAFLWPPQGKESLSADEQKEWKRLHSVIFRAMEDQPTERFLSIRKLGEAIAPEKLPERDGSVKRRKPRRITQPLALILFLIATTVLIGAGLYFFSGNVTEQETILEPFEPGSLSPEEHAVLQRLDRQIRRYRASESHTNVLASLDSLHEHFPGSRNDPQYATFRALALFQLGRTKEAAEEIKRGLTGPIDYVLLQERTQLWRRFDDLERAEEELTKSIEWRPDRRLYLSRAHFRAETEDFQGTDDDLKAAGTDAAGLRQLRTHFSLQYPQFKHWLSTLDTP